MSAAQPVPATHKALVQETYGAPPVVATLPMPQPTPGSAVLRVLAVPILSYARELYNGTLRYPYPTPMVLGTNAIGRVAAVGPDATRLQPGDLVLFDSTIRGRDDPEAIMLSGVVDGGSAGGRKLMEGEWRDSSYAEFVKVPLENAIPLDEARLCGGEGHGYGYSPEDIARVAMPLVPFGGLRSIRVEAGETVIVAPATGSFGGAAVRVAIAMGARVLAMGRNEKALRALEMQSDRIHGVLITGNVEQETAALAKFGKADAFFDISPRAAAGSSHFKSAIMSLRRGGRACLMGGIQDDVPIPHPYVMRQNIKIQGNWMYTRDDIVMLLKMVNIGLLKLDDAAGVKTVGKFSLEQWKEAFDTAAEHAGPSEIAIFTP